MASCAEMEMTGQRQLTYPRDLSVQYSDKILMRINRPHNFQQTIDLSFEDFSRGRHTDVTFIPDDGAQVKVHGFLLSAASPFLRDVLSNTFSPSLEYVLMVPGVKPEVVSCLAQLLYGATVVTCKKSLDQLSDLLNLLGVQLSLVSQPAVLTEQEQEQTEEMEEDEDDSSVAMLKYDDKNTIPTSVPGTEETVETVGELPLCCYHCSLPFSSFETLNSHICTQASTGRRHHRCNQCGAVLSSMWRLRQHLATHSLSWGRGKTDHMYGRSSRRVQSKARPQAGDHGYAGADHRQEAVSVSSTPPSSRVQSEHSYGTKRDSSPEGTEAKLGADYNRSDHIYSADAERDDEETDTDNEMTDKPPGEDHQYFSSPERERSSPRFRKLLPKNSTVTEDSSNNSIGKFSCSNCHKTFPQAYRLRRHVREVHEKEKMYQCDECDKKFFKTNSLNRHKTQVHDQLRPYACRNCSSKFKDKSALNYHTRKNVCFIQK